MKLQAYYMPTVAIAAIIAGLVGATPCLNTLNCCFCMPAWLAAMLAVRAIGQRAQTQVEAGEGAVIGLIVGGGAGVLTGLGTGVMQFISPGILSSMPMVAQNPALKQQLEATNPVAAAGGSFCCWFIGFALFGALGGLIGASVFKPTPAPQAY